MKLEFDPAKNERNIRERGLAFERAADFDWEGALFSQDARFDYPEARFVALGNLGKRLHVICFAPIAGGIRVISFRKANEREVRTYDKEKASHG